MESDLSKRRKRRKKMRRGIGIVLLIALILFFPIDGLMIGPTIWYFVRTPLHNVQRWMTNSYIRNLSDWQDVQLDQSKFKIPENWHLEKQDWGIECTNDDNEVVAQIYGSQPEAKEQNISRAALGIEVTTETELSREFFDTFGDVYLSIYQVSDGSTTITYAVACYYDEIAYSNSTAPNLTVFCNIYCADGQTMEDIMPVCEAITYSMKSMGNSKSD